MSNYLVLLLLLLIAMTAAQVPSLPINTGSCLPVIAEDFGPTMSLDESMPFYGPPSGIVLSALDQPEIGPPEVRILDFHVVCESAGLMCDTTSSVSAVVTFECTGQQCQGGGRDPVNVTEQFTFRCLDSDFDGRIIYEPLLFPVFPIRRLDPVASFDTAPDLQCGSCLDPANGIPVNDETHCIGEQNLCSITKS